MPEKVIVSPTDKELFSLSFKRIFASALCGVRLHQPWLYVDRINHKSTWYCAFCGHVINEINVEIK